MGPSYILTEQEYLALITTQNEPSTLLQATIDNLKDKLRIANSTIDELNEELQTYHLAGAKRREPILHVIVNQYNDAWFKHKPSVMKTSELASKWLLESNHPYTSSNVRKILRTAVKDGTITKTSNGTYTVNNL